MSREEFIARFLIENIKSYPDLCEECISLAICVADQLETKKVAPWLPSHLKRRIS